MGSLHDPKPTGLIYLLFANAYLWTACVIPPRIPLSNISNISGSVRSSNLTLVFFRQAFQANPGVILKCAGSRE